MKKNILFLWIIICFLYTCNNCLAQSINYAFTKNDFIFTTGSCGNDSSSICLFQYENKNQRFPSSIPLHFRNANNNLAWSMSNDIFVLISDDISVFRLNHQNFNLISTYNNGLTIPVLHDYRQSYFNSNFRIPKKLLSHEIFVKNNRLIQYYLRDDNALYIYDVPIIDYRGYIEMGKWKEKKVYKDSIYSFVKKTENKVIKDSLFFEGNFKVIVQGKNTFVFNLKTGRIYLMGNKKIEHLGTLSISDDYPLIQGKKLIIEDRDNGEIIIFASVSWENTKLPKPKLRKIIREEMEIHFKYIL